MEFLLISDFLYNFIKYARYVVIAVACLSVITLIIAVLFQNSNNSADSITGGYSQESYYSKHKGTTIEEKLNKLTIWSSCIVAVCIVMYYLSCIVLPASI